MASRAGNWKDKPGYRKIEFCARQADRDGLRYFWVDTCCIDKRNHTELHEAINSMFRWYQNSARCYVYLSDVPAAATTPTLPGLVLLWQPYFRRSRWFTRGWTLQGLLAPSSVEFFSREGQRLGDRGSLLPEIHEITRINTEALEKQRSLPEFGVRERFEWAGKRQTGREEDWAYCLLGIFGVFIPLIYGEGKENAVRRLKKEIEASTSSRQRAPANDPERQSKMSCRSLEELLGTFFGDPVRCYRCDAPAHLLPVCFASAETVRKGRGRRMRDGDCVNCGSRYHRVEYCPFDDLRELRHKFDRTG